MTSVKSNLNNKH